MKRVLALVQIAALLMLIAVCVMVALLLIDVRHALLDANAQLHVVTQGAAAIERKVTLDLDEAHRVLLESGLTAMEARKASTEERAALPKLTAQSSRALTSLDDELVALRNTTLALGEDGNEITRSTELTLDGVDATVRSVQPVLAETKVAIAGLEPVERDLDARVNDPAIAASLHNVDMGTAALAASAKDVQQEVHAITHPGWVRRCWHAALDVAHVFNPL